MNEFEALKLALDILEPFGESSLYEDYKRSNPANADSFTDDQYDQMLATLQQMLDERTRPNPLSQ